MSRVPVGAPAGARRMPILPTAVARADPERATRLATAERRIGAVARVLDDLVPVPGTGRRVGLEPLLGLLPVGGDVLGTLANAWVVAEAARFRLPRVVLVRMVLNVALDLVIGAIPLVGDLFDFGFKASSRNLALFRRHASDPGASTTGDRAILAGLLLLVLGVGWATLLLVSRLLEALAAAL